MRLGLALPHYPFSFPEDAEQSTAQRAVSYAKLAEDAGFHQVWVSDHFYVNVAPPGQPEQRHEPAECWTLLAAVAAATRRIRIGSLATPVGFRNPGLFARMVATVEQLSTGRLDVTLGAGWNEAEYQENGLPFGPVPQRLAALGDAVLQLRRQCPGVPVWVGGKRPKLLAIAATADGWNTAWDCTAQEYGYRHGKFVEACHRRGRNPHTVRRTLGLTTLMGRDADDVADRWRHLQRWAPGGALNAVSLQDWAKSRLVGTREEIRNQLDGWCELGIEQVVLSCGAPFAVWEDEQLSLIAELLD